MAHNLVSLSSHLTGIHAGNQMSFHFRHLGLSEMTQFSTPKRQLHHFRGDVRKAQQFKHSLPPSSRNLYFIFSCSAVGSNISEDTDDMFDDLFDKYGKVVFQRKDKKPCSAEIDDDAESLSFAVAMAKVANEVKAGDIKVLFVKPLVYWTRFFIIATAFSRPQIDAIRTKMADLAEEKFGKSPNGDSKPNSWTLLDFGDVVVHLFLPQQRSFYNLEEFYGNATPIELPFEDEKPFQR